MVRYWNSHVRTTLKFYFTNSSQMTIFNTFIYHVKVLPSVGHSCLIVIFDNFCPRYWKPLIKFMKKKLNLLTKSTKYANCWGEQTYNITFLSWHHIYLLPPKKRNPNLQILQPFFTLTCSIFNPLKQTKHHTDAYHFIYKNNNKKEIVSLILHTILSPITTHKIVLVTFHHSFQSNQLLFFGPSPHQKSKNVPVVSWFLF